VSDHPSTRDLIERDVCSTCGCVREHSVWCERHRPLMTENAELRAALRLALSHLRDFERAAQTCFVWLGELELLCDQATDSRADSPEQPSASVAPAPSAATSHELHDSVSDAATANAPQARLVGASRKDSRFDE
jgi:hypothetical protein